MSEKEVHVVEVQSLDDALARVTELAEVFREVGLLVLRGCTFSVEDQVLLSRALGDIFSWNVNSKVNSASATTSTYNGGHSDRTDRDYIEGPSEYVLDWHIEQVYYKHPILAGVWNMDTFTAPHGSGDTRFVDSIELYSQYNEDDRDFLEKSVVVWDKPTPQGAGPFYTKVVDNHPITGAPLLRVETDRGSYSMPKLAVWDGNIPTDEQIVRLDTLLASLKDRLNNDLSVRYSQKWQENDLLIVDLFRMYHAVMGGFGVGQRKFTGIGVRPINHDNSMHRTLESWING